MSAPPGQLEKQRPSTHDCHENLHLNALFPHQLAYLAAAVVSGAIVAGALAWYLVRAMAATGVLAPFRSGRRQRLI